MTFIDVICIIALWSILGFPMLISVFSSFGANIFNPFWIYKNTKVNVFGAVVLTFIAIAISPITALIYYMYKLCTVGRKQ